MKKLFPVFLVASFLLVPTANAQLCGFFGIGCPPPSPFPPKIVTPAQYIVPEFEKVNVITQTIFGPRVVPANDTYFATLKTAQDVAARFGGARVEEREAIQNLGANYLYTDGKPAVVRVVIFSPGTVLKNNTGDVAEIVKTQFEVNAGLLADYFRRMPEKQFPPYVTVWGNPGVELHYLSLAEQYVWRVLVSLQPHDSGSIRLFRFEEGVPVEKNTL